MFLPIYFPFLTFFFFPEDPSFYQALIFQPEVFLLVLPVVKVFWLSIFNFWKKIWKYIYFAFILKNFFFFCWSMISSVNILKILFLVSSDLHVFAWEIHITQTTVSSYVMCWFELLSEFSLIYKSKYLIYFYLGLSLRFLNF